MSDELDSDAGDQLAAIGRGVTSLVPFVGGVLGELVTQVIPNQRMDRVTKYLRQLEDRLATLEADRQRDVTSHPDKIDLIEEGGNQAARATSGERIDRIAEAVFNGLTSGETDVVRRKRLLSLLGQIDDDELILLNAYGQSYGNSDTDAWDKANRPEPAYMGASVAIIDGENLYEAGRDNLLRLGLLRKRVPNVKRGEYPEFDSRKGEFKHTVEISYIGRMLLREVGMPSPFDVEAEGAGAQAE